MEDVDTQKHMQEQDVKYSLDEDEEILRYKEATQSDTDDLKCSGHCVVCAKVDSVGNCCLDIMHEGEECTCDKHRIQKPLGYVSYGGSTGSSGPQRITIQLRPEAGNTQNIVAGQTGGDTTTSDKSKDIEELNVVEQASQTEGATPEETEANTQ